MSDNKKINNPRAFPVTQIEYYNEKPIGSFLYEGMDLRDYFAAKAMNAMCGKQIIAANNPEGMALVCYEIADAMLKAREE